jgi:hypothetical protein
MAFTVDYEERADAPLALAALLAQTQRTGVAPSAAGLERARAIEPSRDRDAPVKLTARGRRIREPYEDTVAAVTELWRARHGAEPVDTLCDELMRLDDATPGAATRPDGVLMGFMGGFGFVNFSTEQP